MKKILKILLSFIVFLAVLYLILLIPGKENPIVSKAVNAPFLWDKDQYWNQLEREFKDARSADPDTLKKLIETNKLRAESLVSQLKENNPSSSDTIFQSLHNQFFSLAPLIAVDTIYTSWFIDYYNAVRVQVKLHSRDWDMDSPTARNTVYSVLYGMRAAVEEVLLQSENIKNMGTMIVNPVASKTPSTELLGIKIHSGDLLLSRGGAEVSALISRGNDYPGNFSHVALVYIEEQNNTPYIIEAHIEKGVAITDLEGYMKDKKLRVMVLRPRGDLPAIQKDPMLAHKAAQSAYDESNTRHIPYDFKMDFHDPSAMFCSEVGSYAYQQKGITLWQSVSTISSQGIVDWMHSFGVENFVTQLPSDLEYDPQLAVVGEWRDKETLFKDHVDNAIVDVMLESANDGSTLKINQLQLPLARTIKAYCVLLNKFGEVCIIPEGMSATTALRNNAFVSEFQRIKEGTTTRVKKFTDDFGYRPPYWKLVSLAMEASQYSE